MRRTTFILCLVMLCSLQLGCRFMPKVSTFNRICGPVKIDANPIRVETSEVEVAARIITQDTSSLSERQVRACSATSSGKIVIVELDGLIVNQNLNSGLMAGDNPVSLFREKLDTIAYDSSVRAVVLRINSQGGGVTASDVMRRDLEQFMRRTNLPVVACLMDVGAGGAYYLSTAANEIVAHPTTVIGGIGVILNLYNLEDALSQLNIVGVPVKAGKFVDMGSPLRELPTESRELLQGIANDFHERFLEVVRSSRGSLKMDEDLLDGRVFTSQTALKNGLIDTVGYMENAIGRAEELGGCVGASVVVLRRDQQTARTPYDIAGMNAGSLSFFPQIPGLDRSRLPTFLYMWQPDPSVATGVGP